MSEHDLAESYDALLLAHSLEPRVVYNIYQLAQEWSMNRDSVSPSDFLDHLSHEYDICSYVISAIVLDGSTSNLTPVISNDHERAEDAENYTTNLKFIDGILWGKYLQHKFLERLLRSGSIK